MIWLKSIAHRHDWKETEFTFALLPNLNLPPGHNKGLTGTIEQCECGSKRFVHPNLRSVSVEEVRHDADGRRIA